MKANEFVKEFGWEYSKHIVNEDSVILIDLDYNDLKRLVASHELVGLRGGLSEAKEYLDERHIFTWDALDVQLKQAILDVESCQ